MGEIGSNAAEDSNFSSLACGLGFKGFIRDGAAVMASSWSITCLHCSTLFPKDRSDDSPTPLWGGAGVAGFGSFTFNFAWLHQACFGVSSIFWESPPWLHVHAGISTRQKSCHNAQHTTDNRIGQGNLTTYCLNPILTGSFPNCHDPYIFIKGPVIWLSPLYPSFPNAFFRDARHHKSSDISTCPSLPRGLSLPLLHILWKLLSRCWLAESLMPLILNINNRNLILTITAKKKEFELMVTAVSEVKEGKERPPHLPQSLGR